MAATQSIYNLNIDNNLYIDNELSFTPGPTAGYVLAIGVDGVSYWIDMSSSTDRITTEDGNLLITEAGYYIEL